MNSLQDYRQSIRTEKRQTILEAALTVFLSQGFKDSGMALIAKQADVSTATLYKHFTSKDQLFGEIVAMHVNKFNVLPFESYDLDLTNLDQALLELSDGFIRLISEERTINILRNIIGEGDRFPVLQDLIYKKGRAPFKRSLVDFLSTPVVAAQLNCADPSIAAEWYIGLLSYWLVFVRVFNPEIRYSEERVQELINESIAMFLARYRKPSS